jgi:hypothetical protein
MLLATVVCQSNGKNVLVLRENLLKRNESLAILVCILLKKVSFELPSYHMYICQMLVVRHDSCPTYACVHFAFIFMLKIMR